MALHIARNRRRQSICSHLPINPVPVVGDAGRLLPHLWTNIFLFADFKTLVQAAKVNDTVRDAARLAFKTLVKEKLKLFFDEEAMPQFFAELRRARGYICGDVPLSIILRANWEVSELHITIPRGGASELMLWIAFQGYFEASQTSAYNGPRSLHLENPKVGIYASWYMLWHVNYCLV